MSSSPTQRATVDPNHSQDDCLFLLLNVSFGYAVQVRALKWADTVLEISTVCVITDVIPQKISVLCSH